jgi:hypothetical protein
MAGHVQRAENELGGLLKIHALSASMQRSGRGIDWSVVRRSVLRSRPPYAHYIEALEAFVISKAGGTDGKYLTHWAKSFYVQCVTPSLRSALPGPLYFALSELPHPFLSWAIWATAYTCPKDAVKNKVCTWITAVEVLGLVRNKSPDFQSKVLEAEEALRDARLRAFDAGLPHTEWPGQVVLVFARLDAMISRWILNKQDGSKTPIRSVAEALWEFSVELRAAAPGLKHEALPWTAPVRTEESKAAASSGPAPVQLYDIDEKGQSRDAVPLLRTLGMDIGGVVSRGSEHYRITAASPAGSDPSITLQGLGEVSEAKLEVTLEDFKQTFKIASERDVVEKNPLWPAASVASHEDFAVIRARGLVWSALAALAEIGRKEAGDVGTLLNVFSRPVKKVATTCQVRAGAIFLPPLSLVLKVQPRTGPAVEGFDENGLVEVQLRKRCGTVLQDMLPKLQFMLSPALDKKGFWPLWTLQTTAEKKDANLSWQLVDIPSLFSWEYQGSVPLQPPASVPTVRQSRKGKAPKSVASGSSAAAASEGSEAEMTSDALMSDFVVSFPCLVNPSGLKAHTDLVAFKPAPTVARKRVPVPISVPQARKARKA